MSKPCHQGRRGRSRHRYQIAGRRERAVALCRHGSELCCRYSHGKQVVRTRRPANCLSGAGSLFDSVRRRPDSEGDGESGARSQRGLPACVRPRPPRYRRSGERHGRGGSSRRTQPHRRDQAFCSLNRCRCRPSGSRSCSSNSSPWRHRSRASAPCWICNTSDCCSARENCRQRSTRFPRERTREILPRFAWNSMA